MRVLVIGSINIDDVFTVDRFVRPGETRSCVSYARHSGGKGGNQALALARAGASVHFAGKVGGDGLSLVDSLQHAGIDISRVAFSDVPTGRAIIQVQEDGQNCILLAPGANRQITPSDIDSFLEGWGEGDMVVFQNEISSMAYALDAAGRKGVSIALNPSPITDSLGSLPMEGVAWLILNETEGSALTGLDDVQGMCRALRAKFPRTDIVLTLGAEGLRYEGRDGLSIVMNAHAVEAVDTTAAGDTFTGYFLAGILCGKDARESLWTANLAAALCVTRAGAQPSIPTRAEVDSLAFP